MYASSISHRLGIAGLGFFEVRFTTGYTRTRCHDGQTRGEREVLGGARSPEDHHHIARGVSVMAANNVDGHGRDARINWDELPRHKVDLHMHCNVTEGTP